MSSNNPPTAPTQPLQAVSQQPAGGAPKPQQQPSAAGGVKTEAPSTNPSTSSNPTEPSSGSAPTAAEASATSSAAGSGTTAAGAPAGGGSTAATAADKASPGSLGSISDQAVLEYLRKKGMGSAALELTQVLKNQGKSPSVSDDQSNSGDDKNNSNKSDGKLSKEQLDDDDRKSILSKATGGGYGYDRDAAAPVVQWGVPDKTTATSKENLADRMGVDEAKALLDSFTSFQLWVLSLPEHDGLQTCASNPILKAQKLIQSGNKQKEGGTSTVGLASVVDVLAGKGGNKEGADDEDANENNLQFHMPPSAKPELFAVAFALLVHTYCELLEVGIESTAVTLRDTFKSVYEPLYAKEYTDLSKCNTTEDIMRLNSHNAQHMESLASLKGLLVNVSNFQLKRDELRNSPDNGMDVSTKAAKQAKIQEYERTIGMLHQKYDELSRRASTAFHKMHDLPFLRRARAVRWQLSMSTATYGLLSSFLNSHDTSLLAMSALLQTKCELHVERRDPLPFTPSCILDDNLDTNGEKTLHLNKSIISWAAPMPRQQREFAKGEKLAFPKFHLDGEYTDEKKAIDDKKLVEFNRALLVNGFRRLEALERKQEYEVLPKLKIAKEDYHHHASSRETANALEPTILMNTLCSNASGPASSTGRQSTSASSSSSSNRNQFLGTAAMWEESGIGLCCAKICPPDGRQVAVGCDDAAVRIWNLMDANNGKEPSQVLLGHKNGFPVFDVSWNRDGRTLLSAAGDGSVRLWDTRAVGYFGKSATVKPPSKKSSKAAAKDKGSTDLEDMKVPGLKTEDSEYASGAALAVYRGHAPNTPIWSVTFAPCGYYFASAGSDATVRLWVTDREVPVRLFTGHTSMIVNCVGWHPNCNYIITGSEDKTARLWDVHSGRTVRLLNGCAAGINSVKISPCGKYAAGADGGGVVHLWDMGSGKKMTEFRNKRREKSGRTLSDISMIHSMSFSACGSGLATGGDDCCVRIWDVRQESVGKHPVVDVPAKTFTTRQTIIMDLSYNKRNLLLTVGKYATPVPSPAVIAD